MKRTSKYGDHRILSIILFARICSTYLRFMGKEKDKKGKAIPVTGREGP
jgi:hypothetical protein